MKSFLLFAACISVWVLELASCDKLPGVHTEEENPVFNQFEIQGSHVREIHLKGGTHCVLWLSSITCDWKNK